MSAGTTARPVLDGVARVVRGEYDFAGKRFEFDQRGAVYLAATPERIRLDLTATRDDPALTAVIRRARNRGQAGDHPDLDARAAQ
jgi:translocation and assembly module TamB